MTDSNAILTEMNDRSREVFRRVVEGYLDNGEPVGSRTLTRDFSEKISAATIRNVMQDLEHMGLLGSPHISGAHSNATWFADVCGWIVRVGELTDTDRTMIDQSTDRDSRNVGDMLDRVSTALSGVTQGASIVLAPKQEAPIKHIEFVSLSQIAHWWFWYLPMVMSKIGYSHRQLAKHPVRCVKRPIF